MGQVIFLAVTFLAMWLLFILPQQRRVRAHSALVAALQVGDEVMTSAGLYGTIAAFEGDDVMLRIAPGVEVKVARGAIAKRVTTDAAAVEAANAIGTGETSTESTIGNGEAAATATSNPPVATPEPGPDAERR